MRIEYENIKNIMILINKFSEFLQKNTIENSSSIVAHKNSLEAIYSINYELYLNQKPLFLKGILDNLLDIQLWNKNIPIWEDIIIDTIAQRNSLPQIDADFLKIMDFISGSSEEEIINLMLNNLEELKIQNPDLYMNLKSYYSIFERMWGQIDIENENISAIKDRAYQLKNHQQDFFWLYQKLGDYRSKKVLVDILNYWLTYQPEFLYGCRENNFLDYFDLDLIEPNSNEVFVDAGSWEGDSTKNFIQAFGCYKKIYCFEITPESIEKCRDELSPFDNIEIVTKALGKENGTFYLNYYGLDHSSNSISESDGDLEVEVVTLDEEIKEKITWIKMDIEGAEQMAILGSKRHIQEEKPKLTISTYHNNEDIWKVPRMIDEMRDDYRFFLRYNGNGISATEFVFFAI